MEKICIYGGPKNEVWMVCESTYVDPTDGVLYGVHENGGKGGFHPNCEPKQVELSDEQAALYDSSMHYLFDEEKQVLIEDPLPPIDPSTLR